MLSTADWDHIPNVQFTKDYKLMLSLLIWPRLITLSGFYCTINLPRVGEPEEPVNIEWGRDDEPHPEGQAPRRRRNKTHCRTVFGSILEVGKQPDQEMLVIYYTLS